MQEIPDIRSVLLGLRWGVFTCVGWQVTLWRARNLQSVISGGDPVGAWALDPHVLA